MTLTGISSKKILDTAQQKQTELLLSLKERFLKEMVVNMAFYFFNILNSKMKINENGKMIDPSEHFKKKWVEGTKNHISSEINYINEWSKEQAISKINQAIFNYQLPSPEDIQAVYVKAINDIVKIFDDNVKKPKNSDDNDDYDDFDYSL